MDNITEEARVYPLKKIKEIRKKDEKKKKFLKFLLSILCCILAFSVGFVSGLHYGDSDPSDKQKKSAGSSSDAKSDSAAATNINGEELETDALQKFEDSFTSIMQEKYSELDFSFSVKNLDSGAQIIHNNKKVDGASVMNLFIMETVLNEAASGNYDLSEDKKAYLTKMIAENNSEAANIFIDDFGGTDATARINQDNRIIKTIESKGYSSTELNQKIYDPNSAQEAGPYTNYTGAKDAVRIMERIYNGSIASEEYSKLALDLLSQQQTVTKIPAKIKGAYPDVVIANKTGELTGIENDVALIMCDDFNLAFAVFVSGIPANEDGSWNNEYHSAVCETIADMSLELVKLYKENNF